MRLHFVLYIFLFSFIFQIHAASPIGYKVGNTAPEFTLKSLDGKTHSLSSLRKKGHVLLAFWAVECVYCYAHIKEFNHAHELYKDKLTVAAINIAGEYPIEVREYVTDNKLKYLVLSERLANLDVGESYHVLGTPTLVLVSPKGQVLFYGHRMPELKNWLAKK
ncbi:MAG: TlpA disulfide reductase family protein [Woeseiaceae bacterium]